VEVTGRDDKKRYLLIECKTDSDLDVEQLRRSRESFLQQNKHADVTCLALTLGASQFTYSPSDPEIRELGFTVLNVSETRRIFSGLEVGGRGKTYYEDWREALQREEERASKIDQALSRMDSPRDERLKEEGCRLGFPVFYMFYAKLRDRLNKTSFKNWHIYSMANNPVMNWADGWLPPEQGPPSLFWEFNWDCFTLKAHLSDEWSDWWRGRRPRVIKLCASSPVQGRRSADRSGTHVSAYRWKFDFCRESVQEVAEKTVGILESVQEPLGSIS